MKYSNTVKGIFIDRPNRFIAHVDIKGNIETVHVKNTGRCKELLIPGVDVILEKSDNPARKTQYDLIGVYKKGLGLVNIDSQAPNKAVYEWLLSKPDIFSDVELIKAEYTFGKSRVDFYMEDNENKILMEVKGCTLEIEGKGYFPDAPTERGVKHLYELADGVKKGYTCYIAFVIAMPGVDIVHPNITTHPEFGKALSDAEKSGVKILYLPCEVKENSLTIKTCILKNHG